jgi:hypothetical protein
MKISKKLGKQCRKEKQNTRLFACVFFFPSHLFMNIPQCWQRDYANDPQFVTLLYNNYILKLLLIAHLRGRPEKMESDSF